MNEGDPLHGPPLPDDFNLVVAVLGRDLAAVDALMDRMLCIPRMINALDRARDGALGSVGCTDAAQESRLRIWRDLKSFNGSSKLETWMYRYCFNVYRESIRRKGSRGGAFLEAGITDPDKVPDARQDLTVDLEEAQLKRQLWQVVDDLPQDQRDVITLKHVDELSFAQIADLTGISINTIKARYYKACRELRLQLKPQMDPNSDPQVHPGTNGLPADPEGGPL